MDWDKLRIFHKVAEAGSLTHAGEDLHLSQSAVSRQIRALEESLDTVLFHRHARGLILTEQGELLAKTTRNMSAQLEATSARIRDAEDTVSGKLDERVLDLPMRDADVAIRMKEPSQADLVRRRLMDVEMQLFASPGYLETYGMPQSMDQIAEHKLITQTVESPQPSASAFWARELLQNYNPSTITINSYFGVLQAVEAGLGIGILPDYLAIEVPSLVPVLPESKSGQVPVFLAYPEELRHSKKVAVFRDFVLQEISQYRKARREES